MGETMQTPTLSTPHQNPVHELERYKALLGYEASAAVEEYNHTNEQSRVLLRGIIDFASGAIRTLLLINGGAAIAVMAFLGNAVVKNSSSASDVAAALHALAPSLFWFVVGVFAAGLSAGLAYVSQVIYLEVADQKRRIMIGNFVRYIAVLSAATSLFMFGLGAWSAHDGLSRFVAGSPHATTSSVPSALHGGAQD